NLSLEEFETQLRTMWFGPEHESDLSSKWTWRGKKNG
ncbi:TIGR00159 family protein, partial [Butyricicoccus sp. 1XD8-22]